MEKVIIRISYLLGIYLSKGSIENTYKQIIQYILWFNKIKKEDTQDCKNKMISRFMNSDDNIKYHKSWNDLIPVIEKCLILVGDDHESEQQYVKIHDALWALNIDEVYKTTIEFIKWYNERRTDNS